MPLVMTENQGYLNGDPHPSNARATIPDDEGLWFGFEQEYFSTQMTVPLDGLKPASQILKVNTTPASVTRTLGDIARQIEEHLDICLAAGINHEGINAEVAKGQGILSLWQGFQKAADQFMLPVTSFSAFVSPTGLT